jgi:hypothetical protein
MTEVDAKILVQALGDYVAELMDDDPETKSYTNLRYQEAVLVALLVQLSGGAGELDG